MSEDTKGKKNGTCNRSACLSPRKVTWYNFSTRKYYCVECAVMLNRANRREAMEIFGHNICLDQAR